MRSIHGVEGPRDFFPQIVSGGQDLVANGRLAAFLGRERNLDTSHPGFVTEVLRLGSASPPREKCGLRSPRSG